MTTQSEPTASLSSHGVGSVATRLHDRALRRVDPQQLARRSPRSPRPRRAAPATPHGVPGHRHLRHHRRSRPPPQRRAGALQGGRRTSRAATVGGYVGRVATPSPNRGSDVLGCPDVSIRVRRPEPRDGPGPRRPGAARRDGAQPARADASEGAPAPAPVDPADADAVARAEAGDPRVRVPLLGHHRRLHAPRARRRAAELRRGARRVRGAAARARPVRARAARRSSTSRRTPGRRASRATTSASGSRGRVGAALAQAALRRPGGGPGRAWSTCSPRTGRESFAAEWERPRAGARRGDRERARDEDPIAILGQVRSELQVDEAERACSSAGRSTSTR